MRERIEPSPVVFLSVDLRVANYPIIRCKVLEIFFAFVFIKLGGFPGKGKLDTRISVWEIEGILANFANDSRRDEADLAETEVGR